jgi:NADPH:quinone reductase-like Zn-dependent oxidoreductase
VRAVGITRFGGPEVLEVVELEDPLPQEGEVRIRVAAATVNPTDTGLRAGRRAAMLKDVPPPYVPGMELAGEVDAVGPGAEWHLGDRVIAIVVPTRDGRGAQAERVVVPARSVAPLPSGVSFEQGATLPMNGLTVRRALDVLALSPGQVLGVTGAAGAVGGYAIELGKLEGLLVIADAAERDEELVRALGADVVVPRGEGAAAAMRKTCPYGVDAVLDSGLMGPAILPAIRDGGALAAVRPFQGETERDIAIHLLLVNDYVTNQAALIELSRLAGEGKLTLRVARTFRPEQAPEVHRLLEAGGVRGRLVILF